MFVVSQIIALFTAWSLDQKKGHKTPLFFEFVPVQARKQSGRIKTGLSMNGL